MVVILDFLEKMAASFDFNTWNILHFKDLLYYCKFIRVFLKAVYITMLVIVVKDSIWLPLYFHSNEKYIGPFIRIG